MAKTEEYDTETLEKLIDERAAKKAEEIYHAHSQKAPQAQASAPSTPVSAEPLQPSHPPPRSWEKLCPTCGSPNEDFKEPDLFCRDCGYPMGNVPADFKPVPNEETPVPGVSPACARCGSTKAKVVRK
jgi:hypothetical protein